MSADPVLFYGGPFSNFAFSPIEVCMLGFAPPDTDQRRVISFPTVEHFFQAMKTVDAPTFDAIHYADSPALAKILGNACELRPDWESVKSDVMLAGLREKFSAIAEGAPFSGRYFLEALLATETAPIIEDSPTDAIWGWGRDHKGENRLGKLLEQVRADIRAIAPTQCRTCFRVRTVHECPVRPYWALQG